MSGVETSIKALRLAFQSGKTKPIAFRLQQLANLARMIDENRAGITAALKADLAQTDFLCETSEIGLSLAEVQNQINNLPAWSKPEQRVPDMIMKPGSAYIVREPLGVVLIISPWNYPISLLLKPLAGAIAAGNCVLLKPSEVSPACSSWFSATIPKYLDSDFFKVIEGGPQETTEILKHQFDHIFYTGSTPVGKIVMRAAAEHLTPVTLELGGKSPCIIDSECEMGLTVRRVCSGKFGNCGQTCVAPDYILVHKDVEAQFIEKLKSTITTFYGEDPSKSADYSRIINTRHTERLAALIAASKAQGDEIIFGGQVDVQNKYISPTLVKVANPSTSKLMEDEIFGPILPIITVQNLDEAIKFSNSRPKPLALYIFTKNNANAKKVIDNTTSGGASVNETVLHVACKDLPFGGVGPSGMGAYNGKSTFETFSHKKGVLHRPTWGDSALRYPPMTEKKLWWIRKLSTLKLPSLGKIFAFLLPVFVAIGAYYYTSKL